MTTFEGEGGSDHGGLFRDSLREICAELQSDGVSGGSVSCGLHLLVPCPNQRLARGANQDKWLPRPSSATAGIGMRGVGAGDYSGGGASAAPGVGGQALKMLKFLGALMGASLRTDSALELDLPSLVWKPLVGELCDFSDLAAIDEALAADLVAIRDCQSPQHWATTWHSISWRVPSISGHSIELLPGGANRKVLWEERLVFVEEAVRVRLCECDAEIEAIKAGFISVVPSLVLPLFTWRELEAKVCGTPIVDVEILKKMTDYNMPRKDKHPVAVMFWQVVTDMSNADRGALLAFANGRRRLPVQNSGGHLRIELLHGRGDEALPEAHTCFFTIDLPQYSSTKVCRDKLMYAIHNCTAIDKDLTTRGGALYDPEEDAFQPLDTSSAPAKLAGAGGLREDMGEFEGGLGAGGCVLGSSRLFTLSCSPSITPLAGDEMAASACVDGGGVGGQSSRGVYSLEPLTAEAVRNCWNSVVGHRPYLGTHTALLDTGSHQLCIPRDGCHDDTTDAVRVPTQPPHAHGALHAAYIVSAHSSDNNTALAESTGGFYALGLGGMEMGSAGMFGWDPGMLDRMQAADVYSGVSGVGRLHDSGDGSACEEEGEEEDEVDDDRDDSHQDDDEDEDEYNSNSTPRDADDTNSDEFSEGSQAQHSQGSEEETSDEIQDSDGSVGHDSIDSDNDGSMDEDETFEGTSDEDDEEDEEEEDDAEENDDSASEVE